MVNEVCVDSLKKKKEKSERANQAKTKVSQIRGALAMVRKLRDCEEIIHNKYPSFIMDIIMDIYYEYMHG